MQMVWLPFVVVAYVVSVIASIGIVIKYCQPTKSEVKPDVKPEEIVTGTPVLTVQVAVVV